MVYCLVCWSTKKPINDLDYGPINDLIISIGHIPPEVPQILINREPLRHMRFDVELLGDCDVIVSELCQRLGGDWLNLLNGCPEIPCVERRAPSVEEQNSGAVDNPAGKSNDCSNYQVRPMPVCEVSVIRK